jgi:hypothetical protein
MDSVSLSSDPHVAKPCRTVPYVISKTDGNLPTDDAVKRAANPLLSDELANRDALNFLKLRPASVRLGFWGFSGLPRLEVAAFHG